MSKPAQLPDDATLPTDAWDDIQWGGNPREAEAFYRERSPSTWARARSL